MHCVDLGESVPTSIYLQNVASIQPRSSLVKFARSPRTDPFKKVKKMIDSMITKLLEEANAESDKKGWCDKEIAAAQKDRDYRLRDVDDLHSQLESPLPEGGEVWASPNVCVRGAVFCMI